MYSQASDEKTECPCSSPPPRARARGVAAAAAREHIPRKMPMNSPTVPPAPPVSFYR